jgi:trimeric autotransporter adhesin
MNVRGKAVCVLFSLFVFAQTLIFAGEGQTNPVKPLSEILNPDGTVMLKPGIRGSFDPQGFRIISEPGQPPRFVPARAQSRRSGAASKAQVSDEGYWDDRFFGNGPSSEPIAAVAISGDMVYVGGEFRTIGNIRANYVARWDGSSWSALGSGTNGFVGALAVSGTVVYVGGRFTSAGGIPVNNIAKWDGSAWSALGSGIPVSSDILSIRTLAVSGTDLYVGGDFAKAGGIAVNHIARWDGNAWSSLGSGTDGTVNAIAVSGTDVYVSGYFATAGGIAVNYLAKWDGNTWAALGSGAFALDWNPINALAVSGTNLYVGGSFTTVGGMAVNHIARWDGSAWSSLGSGTDERVNAITISGTDIFVAGEFTTAGGMSAKKIAKWNGNAWSSLDSGIVGTIYKIAASAKNLYAAGEFWTAGGIFANDIAEWDGSAWSALGPVGNGLDHGGYSYTKLSRFNITSVCGLAASGTNIYAQGTFFTAGGIYAYDIAKWDGSAWSALGSGVAGSAIAVSGMDVYVGGIFSSAGGVPANAIAKWDGSAWSALGSGIAGEVNTIAICGTSVYVGGMFKKAGGIFANNIAKWDGSAWSTLGSGINGRVKALAMSGTDVYAVGDFTTAGPISVNHIAKWNGNAWAALGSGTDGSASAIAVNGTDVYVGGYFLQAGGIPANNVAKWDGSSWSALGSGIDDGVSALVVQGKEIYATSGGFIVRWNGYSWSQHSTGTNGGIEALAAVGADLYCGGGFTIAGDKPSLRFGIWHSNFVLTSPNGGEFWGAGSLHQITWLSLPAVGDVKLEYSTNGGGSWTTIAASTPNDGSYDWAVPAVPSSNVLVRISEAVDGDPSDVSNAAFTIVTEPTIVVTSPNGGETWSVGSEHDVRWISLFNVGNVKIEVSTDDGASYTTIVASTANTEKYRWTVPNNPSPACRLRISQVFSGVPVDASDGTFTILLLPPTISLSRTRLSFGAVRGGPKTDSQKVLLRNSGSGQLNWTATSDTAWLKVTPESGSGSAVLSIGIDPAALAAGSYYGHIWVSDPSASNPTLGIYVSLTLNEGGKSAAPFGYFDTPLDNTVGIAGTIPVTGWALDDIGVAKVEINRDPVPGDSSETIGPDGLIYIGDAIFVEGARPDIETIYPEYPLTYKAGWGYMLLTNFLPPNKGNGVYRLHAIVTDYEGNTVELGTKTITCDNAHAVKPFGAIDTPAQGGDASGATYYNFGWALTPLPNSIPLDGSTINVWVDGVMLGHPDYNHYRQDIATKFPGLANTDGAIGVYTLDTTKYANAVHTIAWSVQDNGGNLDGIGSRFFNILNTGILNTGGTQSALGSEAQDSAMRQSFEAIGELPLDFLPVFVRTGFKTDAVPTLLQPDDSGTIRIEIGEVDRVELNLGHTASIKGYSVVGKDLQPLPIGSTLDAQNGTFSWMPGPGFLGEYEFVFLIVPKGRVPRACPWVNETAAIRYNV